MDFNGAFGNIDENTIEFVSTDCTSGGLDKGYIDKQRNKKREVYSR